MKLRYASVGLAAALSVLSSSAFAGPSLCNAVVGNLVTDCGFEASSTAFTGWTLSGLDVPGEQDNLYGVEAGSDPNQGTDPHSGSNQAFFADQIARATTLSQTLATVAGRGYVVSFYLDQELFGNGNRNALTVAFGGSTLATLTNVAAEPYTLYTYQAYATGPNTMLSLTFGNDLGQFLLDDVAVRLPEPSTIALFAVAATGLGWSSRRRRRA